VIRHSGTSGRERAHCVAGHIELTERIFGHQVGDDLHAHAMPQGLAKRMGSVQTVPGVAGKSLES